MGTHKITVIATDKTESNAEAIIKLAVMRNGCDDSFYSEVPAGKYKSGDEWID